MSPRRRPQPGDWNDLFAEPGTRPAKQRPEAQEPPAEPLSAQVAPAPGDSPEFAIPVAALNEIARLVVEGAFVPLWVRGEVCDFTAHRNGHWYFSLRDAGAQVRCVVWNRDQHLFLTSPDDGMQVVVLGQPTVYTARGDLQLAVRAIQAEGDGLRRKAVEQARARLQRDGLLDPARRRRLPADPRCIAVITSPSGAALHDIIAVVRRRAPSVELVVIPARVQGAGAPADLIAALERLQRWGGADLLIIGRGGGANEDLSAFDDERVARTLAACAVPTISAVGHEVDTTLCDLVADLRAPTPSAAAERAVPDIRETRLRLRAVRLRLRHLSQRFVAERRNRLARERGEMTRLMTHALDARRSRLGTAGARLDALSPLATLARGYAVARDPDGRTLRRAAAFVAGEDFHLLLADGTVRADTRAVTLRPEREGS